MAFTIADATPGKTYAESSFGERLQNLRTARGLTQVHLAQALNLTTDELPSLKPPKIATVEDDSEDRYQWRRLQAIAPLSERDQKAFVRLINFLAAGSSLRRNGNAPGGERHDR